ncbi:hypothetical protein JTE90_006013 [Oedothorax gibbosus]|uniref:Uncharacterized protein n=1 Tax=Oedothorax gibbosus TaxID=931172 RepID=A0AAV6TLW8_9ARAC|nr:hypothetical protein JTE90_006013 [Oedothorax gibbosus]
MKVVKDDSKVSQSPISEDAILTADKLIKWAVATRKQHVKMLRFKLHSVRGKSEVGLIKSELCTSVEEKYKSLTGKSLHTCSSEPFYVEPTYKDFTDRNFPIAVGIDGKCYNIFNSATMGNLSKKPFVEHSDEESKQPSVWCVGSSVYFFRNSSGWKEQERRHNVLQRLQEQTEKWEILPESPGVLRKFLPHYSNRRSWTTNILHGPKS